MKFKTSTESNDFDRPVIPEGLYTGVLSEIIEFEGDYGKALRFMYSIEGQDNVKLSYICSIPEVVNPNNKLGKTFEAHGIKIDGENDVETELLLGTKAKVWVENATKKDLEGKEVTFSKISKVKKIE